MFNPVNQMGLLYQTNAEKFIEVFGYVDISNPKFWDAQYLGDRNMISKTNKEKFQEVFGLGINVIKLDDEWANAPYGLPRPLRVSTQKLTQYADRLTQYADVRGRVVNYDETKNRYKVNFAREDSIGGVEVWVNGDQIVNITNA